MNGQKSRAKEHQEFFVADSTGRGNGVVSKSDFYGIKAIIFGLHEDSLVEICDWNLALVDYMLCNLSFRRLNFCLFFLELWT